MLQEVYHYAKIYHAFLYGDKQHYNELTNFTLEGLRKLKQTTVYLFLFSVFDDLENHVITEEELDKVLTFLLSYSIRRLICDIPSNSFRGLYKSLYSRVFSNPENKKHYYDSIVSFMMQLNSKDVIPDDMLYKQALLYNNLYRKNALCKYLFTTIENQGKEILETGNLTIEHIMPQNKDLSVAWQQMLGPNWEADRDKYLHTLGNLTLTGYNSELGDKPFEEKLDFLDEKNTKITALYQDVKNCKKWNADSIENRAKNLSNQIFSLFPIIPPEVKISFIDPRYKEYTCDTPDEAEFKKPCYYVLQGEKVMVDSFAAMLISVCERLYEIDNSIIEEMARNNEHVLNGSFAFFSYDRQQVNTEYFFNNSDIYMSLNYGAPRLVKLISIMLNRYNIENDEFVYCAIDNSKKSDEGK